MNEKYEKWVKEWDQRQQIQVQGLLEVLDSYIFGLERASNFFAELDVFQR